MTITKELAERLVAVSDEKFMIKCYTDGYWAFGVWFDDEATAVARGNYNELYACEQVGIEEDAYLFANAWAHDQMIKGILECSDKNGHTLMGREKERAFLKDVIGWGEIHDYLTPFCDWKERKWESEV